MTPDDLLSAGYREYSPPGPWTGADRVFQRCVRPEEHRAKLYFINVGMWDFRKYPGGGHVGWEAEAHFYRGPDRSFRLHVPIEPVDTVPDVEGVFAEFYERMGCVPDIHNQDCY